MCTMTEEFLIYYILIINSILIGYVVGVILYLIYVEFFK